MEILEDSKQIPLKYAPSEDEEGRVEYIANGVDSEFHVFTWLTSDGSGPSQHTSTSDTEARGTLDLLDTYIVEHLGDPVRGAYCACDPSIIDNVDDYPLSAATDGTQRDIRRSMNEYLQMLAKMDQNETKGKQDAGLLARINLYNAAEDTVRFFVPPSFGSDVTTVGKFWKSLESLIRPYSPQHFRDESLTSSPGEIA